VTDRTTRANNQSEITNTNVNFYFFSCLIFHLFHLNQSAGRQSQRGRFRRHEIGWDNHDRQRLSLGSTARKLARLLDPFAQVKPATD
jgi:hypothetical protein